MKAPGTDTMTTFLSTHSVVESLIAEIWFDSLDLSLKEDDRRTDSAGRLEEVSCAFAELRQGRTLSSSSGVYGMYLNEPSGMTAPTLMTSIVGRLRLRSTLTRHSVPFKLPFGLRPGVHTLVLNSASHALYTQMYITP